PDGRILNHITRARAAFRIGVLRWAVIAYFKRLHQSDLEWPSPVFPSLFNTQDAGEPASGVANSHRTACMKRRGASGRDSSANLGALIPRVPSLQELRTNLLHVQLVRAGSTWLRSVWHV